MSYYIGPRCSACHYCFNECPVQAIRFAGTSYEIDEFKCIGCGKCAEVCPTGALKLIGMEEQLMRVTVILLAMPVAYTTAILAERYNANYHFAGKCVCLSTVLSLLTVPLICMLL